MTEIAALSVGVTGDITDLQAKLGQAGREVGGFSSTLAGIGAATATAFAAAGAGIAAGLAVGVKAAGNLEQSVANISTIKPEIDTSAVFGALNELSTRIPATAAELGDSLYNVFSSMDVGAEQATQLVETFAKGAVGAQTSAETFGTAVMGVMNAYGLSVEDAAHVSDVFFNTVNKGVVTGQELASSLGPVTQAAKAAGVGLDELGAMIAAVTKEGGPAAQNINNLNNFLQKITTKEAQKEIQALGIKTVDATGKFRPTTEVLTELKERLGDMTEAARANALQAIFPDAQARIGAQTLISQLDLVTSATAENAAATGVAEAAYAKMSATFNSQSKLLMNNLMAIGTAIGAEVLPHITPVIAAFSQALPKAFQITKDAARTVQQVFDGNWLPDDSIHPFVNAIGQIAVSVKQMVDTVGPYFTRLAVIVRQALSGDITGAFDAFKGLVADVATALGPILATWGQAFIAWVAPMLPPFLAAVANIGVQLLAWIAQQIPPILAQLALWGQQFVAWVAPMIPPMLAALAALAGALIAWLVEQAPVLLEQLAAWGQAFVDWVAPQIPPLLAALADLGAQMLTWVSAQIPVWTQNLLLWGQEFYAWVAPQVPPLMAELGRLALAMLDWVIAQVPGITAKLVEWGLLFGAWVVTSAIPAFYAESPKMNAALGEWVINAAAELGQRALAFGKALVQGIYDGFTNAWAAIGPKIKEAIASVFVLPSFSLPPGGIPGATTMSNPARSPGGTHASAYMDLINKVTAEMHEDPALVAAIMDTEGSGAGSTSPAGARGLMQVMPNYVLPGENPFDPETSIRQGIRAIQEKRRAVGNDPADIAGAYFGYGTDAGGMTTGGYRQRFLQNYQRYRQPTGPGAMDKLLPEGMRAPLDLMETVDQRFVPAWVRAMQTVTEAGTQATAIVSESMASTGSTLVSMSTDDLGNVTRIFSENGVAIGATITDAAGTIVNSWGSMAASVTEQTAALATTVPEQTNLMTSGALTSVTALGDGVLTTVHAMAGDSIATVTDMTGQVTSQYATLSNGAQLTMGDMASGVLTSVTDMGQGMVTIVQDANGNMVATVTDATGKVTSQYAHLADEVSSSTREMSSAMSGWGRDTAKQFGSATAAAQAYSKAVKAAAEATESLAGKKGGEKGGDLGRKDNPYAKRAFGGPVEAGMPYVVGDAGRPELFVPDANGYILPRVPDGGGSGIDEGRLARLIARELAAALPRRGDVVINGAGTEEVASKVLRHFQREELMYRVGG